LLKVLDFQTNAAIISLFLNPAAKQNKNNSKYFLPSSANCSGLCKSRFVFINICAAASKCRTGNINASGGFSNILLGVLLAAALRIVVQFGENSAGNLQSVYR